MTRPIGRGLGGAVLLSLLATAPVRAEGHGAPGPRGGHSEHEAHGAHGDHATVHHRFDDVQRWVTVFDDPARDAWQKPAELVAALGLRPGDAVADIGAGTGYFNRYLADAVGPRGLVVPIDIEPGLVSHMARRARAERTWNVTPRLIEPGQHGLAMGEVDLVLLVDTIHHIDDRVDWLTALRSTLKGGGRLVVVDFLPGELPVGPPPDHKLARERVVQEAVAAGWAVGPSLELLPHQYVQVFTLP